MWILRPFDGGFYLIAACANWLLRKVAESFNHDIAPQWRNLGSGAFPTASAFLRSLLFGIVGTIFLLIEGPYEIYRYLILHLTVVNGTKFLSDSDNKSDVSFDLINVEIKNEPLFTREFKEEIHEISVKVTLITMASSAGLVVIKWIVRQLRRKLSKKAIPTSSEEIDKLLTTYPELSSDKKVKDLFEEDTKNKSYDCQKKLSENINADENCVFKTIYLRERLLKRENLHIETETSERSTEESEKEFPNRQRNKPEKEKIANETMKEEKISKDPEPNEDEIDGSDISDYFNVEQSVEDNLVAYEERFLNGNENFKRKEIHSEIHYLFRSAKQLYGEIFDDIFQLELDSGSCTEGCCLDEDEEHQLNEPKIEESPPSIPVIDVKVRPNTPKVVKKISARKIPVWTHKNKWNAPERPRGGSTVSAKPLTTLYKKTSQNNRFRNNEVAERKEREKCMSAQAKKKVEDKLIKSPGIQPKSELQERKNTINELSNFVRKHGMGRISEEDEDEPALAKNENEVKAEPAKDKEVSTSAKKDALPTIIEDDQSSQNDQDDAQSAKDEEELSSAKDEDEMSPVKDEEGASSANDEEDASSANDEEDASTEKDEEGASSLSDEEDASSAEEEEEVSSAKDKEDVSSAKDEEDVSSAKDEEDVSSAKDEEEVSSAKDEEELSIAKDEENGVSANDEEDGSTAKDEEDTSSSDDEDVLSLKDESTRKDDEGKELESTNKNDAEVNNQIKGNHEEDNHLNPKNEFTFLTPITSWCRNILTKAKEGDHVLTKEEQCCEKWLEKWLEKVDEKSMLEESSYHLDILFGYREPSEISDEEMLYERIKEAYEEGDTKSSDSFINREVYQIFGTPSIPDTLLKLGKKKQKEDVTFLKMIAEENESSEGSNKIDHKC